MYTLPQDLVEAGTFTDTSPATGADINDELAAIEIGMKVRRKLIGRWKEEDEKILENEDGDEDQDEDQEEEDE